MSDDAKQVAIWHDVENRLGILYDLERRIGLIQTPSEAKQFADQAEIIRIYAKKIRAGLNIQNRATAIKILCERRGGNLLAGIERQNGRDENQNM